MTSRSITQVLVKGSRYPSHLDVTVLDHHESFEWEETITSKLLTHPNADILNWPYIGFSVLQSAMESGGMYLAFATYERAIVIKTTANELGKMGHDENWKALYNLLSGGSSFSYIDPDEPSKINTQEPTLVAFDLVQHTLTMHVASKAELSHIVGVDLECLYPEARASLPSTIIRKTFGDGVLHGSAYEVLWRKPDLENRSDTIKELLEGDAVALRAWMAVLSAEMKGTIVQSATKIDTRNLPRDDLDLLAQVQQQFDLLEGSKPERSVNEFSTVEPGKTDREFIINNTAFKNKNRAGTAQTVILKTSDGQVIEARIKNNQGRRAIAYIPETAELPSVDLKDITSVETIGLEDLTTASISRIIYMLGILQGTDTLSTSPFIRKIWRPTDEDKAELAAIKEQQNMPITEEDGDAGKWENLNSSQAAVAKAMLSDSDFALVHGPPGTGKTRTIAFVAKQWVNEGKKAFLVAQSNVGVKNIAETLAKDNSLNFKLLVSTQFYNEWHEDIYEGCRENMIQSGEFKEALKAGIMNTPLILCTVNMLFNKQVDKQVFNAIPLERLVVDEASQIFIGDYLALFHKFRGTLKKVCWFGDPKQLPPHQGEQIEGLTSVYDIPHIEQNSLLLDTQYRMPDKIGDFISKAFYGAKLKSHKKVEGYECMRFVDVSTGHEQLKGTSWIVSLSKILPERA
ncbi:hypothetical protein FRC02_000174 [Tulasnella sp. 418]|nr:hypothetical protein FRC02_000174 [Tulasnella sp. 418]